MRRQLRDFLSSESGATSIEYGMVAGMISLGIIPIVIGISEEVDTMYTSILDAFGYARSNR